MVATDERLLTAEEFLHMPKKGLRSELVKGVVVTSSPSSGRHAFVLGRLARRVFPSVEAHGLGEVFVGEPGYKLASNPDTVRGADLAFVRSERVAEAIVPTFPELAPDLVAEVVAVDKTAGDLIEKVHEYLEAGCRLVWVLDAPTRTVTVWTQERRGALLGDKDTLDGGEVLPGFSCPVQSLFD